ncbi:MAG TPA: PAS domain S-box protein, partial [Candidatus Methanoperedens sp.]
MKTKNEGNSQGGPSTKRLISRQKKGLEAIRNSEEKYRVLFDSAPIGIGIADIEGNVLDANRCMEEMTGYSLEELRSVGVGATYVNPQERDLFIKELLEKRNVHDSEVYLKRKDGTIYTALLNAELLELEGQKILLTTARDITGRKQIEKALQVSEKKYSTIVEKGNDGIVIVQDGRLKFANSKMTQITGLDIQDAIGKPFIDFISPDFREFVLSRYEKRMAGENVPNKSEIEIIAREGGNVPVEVNASLVEYDGRPAEICIIRDITAHKRVQKALEAAITEAEEEKNKAQAIISAIGDGIIIQDTNYKILYQN